VRSHRVALEANVSKSLMGPQHPLSKGQDKKYGYLLDVDVHGRGLYPAPAPPS
jgi:hypothetical protein